MSDTEDNNCQVLPAKDIPPETGWLAAQLTPVIAWGETTPNADVCVATRTEAEALAARVVQRPLASLALVQVLRAVDSLSIDEGVIIESLAYSCLQAGPEFAEWLSQREQSPTLVRDPGQPPILLTRENNTVYARLNRPQQRNAFSAEMRDAMLEALDLLQADDDIEQLVVSGEGDCFSIGGELREFGLATDPASSHRLRTRHHPGRRLAASAQRVRCEVHGACIGSGIEIPAFASHVIADPNTWFQLPELSMGLIPGAGGCVSISRRIGRQRTAWLALSGRRIRAGKALEWGLVDALSSP